MISEVFSNLSDCMRLSLYIYIYSDFIIFYICICVYIVIDHVAKPDESHPLAQPCVAGGGSERDGRSLAKAGWEVKTGATWRDATVTGSEESWREGAALPCSSPGVRGRRAQRASEIGRTLLGDCRGDSGVLCRGERGDSHPAEAGQGVSSKPPSTRFGAGCIPRHACSRHGWPEALPSLQHPPGTGQEMGNAGGPPPLSQGTAQVMSLHLCPAEGGCGLGAIQESGTAGRNLVRGHEQLKSCAWP